MTTLELVPPRVPLLDQRTGFISREWYRFFSALYLRVGGPEAETPNELSQDMGEDAGIEEVRAGLFEAVQALSQDPPVLPQERIDALEGEVAELRALVAELEKAIQSINQGQLL